MSYAPIYSKLHELDARISTLENAPKPDVASVPVAPPVVNIAPVAPAPVAPAPATLAEPVPSVQSTNTDAFDVSILAAYATKAELHDVSGFATKADIPDVSGFATKDELPVVPDVSGFATKADIPDVSGFATKADIPDVSGFATKDELPVVPDVSVFATKDELADLYMKFENAVNVIAQLNTKINEANEKIAALEAA